MFQRAFSISCILLVWVICGSCRLCGNIASPDRADNEGQKDSTIFSDLISEGVRTRIDSQLLSLFKGRLPNYKRQYVPYIEKQKDLINAYLGVHVVLIRKDCVVVKKGTWRESVVWGVEEKDNGQIMHVFFDITGSELLDVIEGNLPEDWEIDWGSADSGREPRGGQPQTIDTGEKLSAGGKAKAEGGSEQKRNGIGTGGHGKSGGVTC